MYKFSKAKIIRAVRVLPEAVKIGLAPEEAEAPEESLDSQGPREAERGGDESLQKEIERLKVELENERLENSDLVSRLSLSEKEMVRERENLAAERDRMKAAMQAEAESLKKKAAVEGAEEGRKAGYEEGAATAREEISREYEEKVSSLVSVLEGVHASLKGSGEDLAALVMPRLIRLWELMLSRMLHREVELSEDTVVPVLRTLMERLSDRESILVYLNPGDAEQTADRRDEFGDLLLGVKHLEFIPDPNVEKGSCVVETNLGIYDARWRTQLEQIQKEIDHLFIEGRKDAIEND
ncbi:MAG: hypothetical protein GX181_02610 [Synergistaceae bacterium]|nr:FliH/SctL family protein [Synergistota bacterium]NLM70840.1 hypothetical protein [Synergistaceae bacterium]